DVRHAQFTQTRRGLARAPAAEGGHLYAGGQNQLDSMAVAHVEHLERFAAGAEIQAPVGEHPVDVQDQEFDVRERRRFARLQTTPARSRSWTFSAPTICSSASTTTSAVMR